LTTKYRRKIFNEGLFAYLLLKLKEIRKYYPEIEVEVANHERDHVHMVVSIPPKMSVGSVVRIIKSNTARGMKKKFGFLKDVYWGTDAIWSEGYFVSTVGVDKRVVEKYIVMQGKEDAGQAKLELQ
jgi:putative transposase